MRIGHEKLTVFRLGSPYRSSTDIEHLTSFSLGSWYQIPKVVRSSLPDHYLIMTELLKDKAARTFQKPFLPMTAMLSDLVGTGFTLATAQFVASLLGIILIYGIYKISAFIYDEVTSPIRDVPGPPNPSFLYGNFKELTTSVSQKSRTD